MKKILWLELSEREAESIQGGSTEYSGIRYPVIIRFASNSEAYTQNHVGGHPRKISTQQ